MLVVDLLVVVGHTLVLVAASQDNNSTNKDYIMPNFSQTWDMMRPGEIYSEGGYQDPMNSQMQPPAPSYQISQPRASVQDILESTGYADKMIAMQAEERQKHVEEIKQKTGVAEVQGENQFLRPVDSEKIKKFESLAPNDQMMIGAVAKGTITPDQYNTIKLQQEQEVLKTLHLLARNENTQFTKGGVAQPKSAENIQAFTTGSDKDMAVEDGIKKTQHTNISFGSGGGGGGAGSKPGSGKITASLTQANTIQNTIDKLMDKKGGIGQKVASSEEMAPQYQKLINEKNRYILADILENKGDESGVAQIKALNALDVDVVELPGADMVVDGKPNLAQSEMLQAIAFGASNGLKVSEVLAIRQKRLELDQLTSEAESRRRRFITFPFETRIPSK